MLIHGLLTLALAMSPLASPTTTTLPSSHDTTVRKHTTFGAAIAPLERSLVTLKLCKRHEGVPRYRFEGNTSS